MLRSSFSSIPRTRSILRWTPASLPCTMERLHTTTTISKQHNIMYIHSRVGFQLYDLNNGVLSRELRLRIPKSPRSLMATRQFHSSNPRRAWPFLPAIIGVLKSSTALGVLGTVVRVAMTLVPAFLIRGKLLFKFIRKIPTHFPQLEAKRAGLIKALVYNKYILRVLFTVPTVLLFATLLASFERAPLTGRWRFILISAEEENEIIKTLSDSWRSAVNSVLASTLESGIPPPALPYSDWRFQWVENTLRRLESAVPLLQAESTTNPTLFQRNADFPFPPPSAYPLAARPRPAQVLHSWAEQAQYDEQPEPPISLVGPPYSCLVVEKPDSQNAFSYGFGPNGAGGVVVYTGFLDEVLKNTPFGSPHPETIAMPSFWSQIFGSLVSSTKRQPMGNTPTEEQTAELAVLLAHELAHLLLSHHLESLSSGTILYPSVISIFTDMARTILFPITMLLGPFVNDALAQMGKVHTGEIGRLSEMCNGRLLEIEADVVSARLLAYAGFDAREAVRFWENRINEIKRAECAVQGKTFDGGGRLASWAMGREIHPLNEERVRKLKEELEKWERDWARISPPTVAYPIA